MDKGKEEKIRQCKIFENKDIEDLKLLCIDMLSMVNKCMNNQDCMLQSFPNVLNKHTLTIVKHKLI